MTLGPRSMPRSASRVLAIATSGILLALVMACAPAAAEEAGPPSAEPGGEPGTEPSSSASSPSSAAETGAGRDTLFERVRVIARPPEQIPGSVDYLGPEQLEQQGQTDAHRVLSLVPGVNVQEEDGYGLRPNIGLRGSGSERSQKITLLEDGVLIAPAPYSAPSAYYFPTVARMEGIEVRKGSSSIRQGPLTTGGVLNLISSSIPSEFGGLLDVSGGEDDTFRGRARLGDAAERYGWLVESFRMNTDGFKRLDGGGSTGFDLEDHLVKFRVQTGTRARHFQALEVKLGRTDQVGHETYLGLTDEDFAASPFRRYVASAADRITTRHEQAHLRYLVRAGRNVDVTATVYRNDFFRNWRKLQSVGGVNIDEVLDDPTTFAGRLSILRGDADSADDELAVRNNRRDYYAQGVQTIVGFHPGGRWHRHDLEFGLRYHEDAEDRFQEEDGFAVRDGRLLQTSTGAPGSQSNRISGAAAWAGFVEDTIRLERWTITAGLRFESIDLSRVEYGKNDPGRTGQDRSIRENEVDVWIPGLGANYALSQRASAFVGVHRGFAPPAPGVSRETDPEESVNYEAGYRYTGGLWNAQLVGFFNDYDNLLGNDTVSSGGTGSGDQFNGGAVHVRGLESAANIELGSLFDLSIGVPLTLSYTYTEARFQTSFDSEFEGWGGRVEAGDELPYLPRHQAGVGIGLVRDRWSAHLAASYLSAARTRAGQGPLAHDEATDARLLVDLSANYVVRDGLKLYGQVRNLTDEVYVAARRPAGARPGLPRSFFTGVSWSF